MNFSNEKPLFTLMDSSETGFFFWNEIYDKPALNSFNYGYFYNGGGVGIGDINNDGLPDVYMVGNTFGGRLFVNDGGLKFHQITNTSNTHANGFTHGVTMADVNQDGFLDIYLSRSMTNVDSLRANKLFINNGDETFTERAKEYGVADIGFSSHANFFDYDNDGDPDLYVLNHSTDYESLVNMVQPNQGIRDLKNLSAKDYANHVSKLYRNNGNGTFTDVTVEAGMKHIFFGLSATVSDVNNDGWLDLYCTSDFVDQDHLYINNKNGTFADEIKTALGHYSNFSMGSDIADVNNDGQLDIFTADMMAEDNYRQKQLVGNRPYDLFKMSIAYGYGCQVMRNCLQLNNGNGTFSEIGQLSGISNTDWSWAPLFADFDNDGYKDLFITNGYYGDLTDLDFVNYYSDSIIKLKGGIANVPDMDFVKQVSSTPISNYIFKNKGNGQYEKKTKEWGLETPSFSNGAAYADLDLDGDLDLIVNNFATPSFLYRNNCIENKLPNKYITFGFLPEQYGVVQGTKITLHTDSGIQFQQLIYNHGYLSTMHQILHFGLGEKNTISKVQIEYPNGTIQEILSPEPNKLTVLDMKKGVAGSFDKPATHTVKFEEIPNAFSPAYQHQESYFIDFKDEPLLEQMYSNRGPFVSKGDVNNDGLDDIYFGGAAGQEGCLYLQTAAGKFEKKANPIFITDKDCEDGQSVFFDADGDNDLDLYVTSGSNEVRDVNLFQNRLYINDGSGNYTKSSGLPKVLSNTLCVVALDIDQDGDMDLFVGGNVKPKQFPDAFPSYILRNMNGLFTADFKSLPNAGRLGIINDLAVLDVNDDKQLDMVLAGDWMPITLLENTKGSFKNETNKYGFDKSNGMWNCLYLTDVNKDGRKDIVGGNRGLNSFYTCSEQYPATLYVDDFDQNGEQEAVVNYYFRDHIMYPKYSLDELLVQMPSWRGLFPRYRNYSQARSENIFTKGKYPNMKTYHCYTFASKVFISISGKNQTYRAVNLSDRAQFSPIYAVQEIELFGKNYLLTVGNNYAVDVNQGRRDASIGSLETFADGKFTATQPLQKGFSGEYRQIVKLSASQGKEKLVIIRANEEPHLGYLLSEPY